MKKESAVVERNNMFSLLLLPVYVRFGDYN